MPRWKEGRAQMSRPSLPDFLRELLESPPAAGEGVHNWLFRVARNLHAHVPAGEIVMLLEDRVRNCGRHVPRNEIVSAVQNSLGCAWQSAEPHRVTVQPAPKIGRASCRERV